MASQYPHLPSSLPEGGFAVATDGHDIRRVSSLFFCRVREEKENEQINSEMTESQELLFLEGYVFYEKE